MQLFGKTLFALTVFGAQSLFAGTLLTENFDSVSSLTSSGWVLSNLSAHPGNTWFQGNSAILTAQSGSDDSYIGADYLAADPGAIDLWLMTPEITLFNNLSLTFYTRTTSDSEYADALKVLLSTSGASTTSSSFATTLLTINASEAPYGYPSNWTAYTVSVSGLTGTTTGRFAFEYVVSDVSIAGNYIGIDSLTTTPEPATWSLLLGGAGLAGLLQLRRRASHS
jgi:hypothetical protein